MYGGLSIAVVVPAYQESALIRRTIGRIPSWVDRIVLVDDGSTDGTAERAAASGDSRLRIVRHRCNLGVGAAIATGHRVALLEEEHDAAVVMAGDAQMDPDDLPALLAPLVRGEADYVKGNRLAHPAARRDMPTMRWLGNHVLSWMTRVAIGRPVHDSQCGYTAMSRHAARLLPLDHLWPGYGYPNDLLCWCVTLGLRVQEVVVRPVYGGERSGIGWRHATLVVPWVLLRGTTRRWLQSLSWASPPRHATLPRETGRE